VSNIILLYENQKKIESFLENFLIRTGAQHIFFAAKSGEILVYSGSKPGKKIYSITALLTSIFNVTEELAQLIDENHFKQFFLKGKAWNLFYQNISSSFLVVVIFKEEALLGPVRVMTEELVTKLKEVLSHSTGKRNPPIGEIDGKKLMEDLFRQ
jgi:predicted regulator of Ras-like GTPase activity (Roadblock/LC7/MglB family)